MAKTTTFTVPSEADGLLLSVCTVVPENENPVGLVQIAHGMAEHKERYIPFMEFLAEHGYACVINDHRGHGGSVKEQKDLGYFYAGGAKALVDDLHQLTLYFKEKYPGRKLFLLGHSMGSLAVRSYCRTYDGDIDGLIVSGSPGKSPATEMGLKLNRLLTLFQGERHVSRLFAQMSTGSYGKSFPDKETVNAWLSVNRENVRAYDADPLCGFPFTLNGYRALLTLLKEAYDGTPAGRPDLPVYFVSGEADPCAPNRQGFEEAMQCMKTAGYRCVSGKMYPNMRHEILNETDNMTVYNDLLRTLNEWNA